MCYLNKIIKGCVLVSFLLLAIVPCCFAVEDAIIARVNEELITIKDLKDYINAITVRLSTEGVPNDEIQKVIAELQKTGLSKLIEDKLILSEANTIGIEVNEKLVDSRIDDLKNRYASNAEFTTSLIANGSTLTDLRKTITDQLKIQYIIEHAVKSKVSIKPAEITQYYNDNPDFFQNKEIIDVESIFIASSDNPELAREKAKAALDLLEQGENFTTISEKYSDAPPIGKIERGTLRPEVEEIIFNLISGELSELVEVDSGFFIFRIKEKILPEKASLELVKNKITDYLYQTKLRDQFNVWIEELKEDAYIEVKQ